MYLLFRYKLNKKVETTKKELSYFSYSVYFDTKVLCLKKSYYVLYIYSCTVNMSMANMLH